MKKLCAITIILVLFPYVFTVFVNGKAVNTSATSDLDKYCIELLAKEVSSDYEDEMLKVQAVIVRTSIYQNVKELKKENMESVPLDTRWRKRLEQAWEETGGQVLMYQDQLALLPFHYLSNGKTRNGSEVLQSDDYPYLKVRECLEDLDAEQQLHTEIIPLIGAKVLSTDSAGYVTEVKVGEEVLTGDSFRDTHELPSSCFELQQFEQVTRVISKGVGHGLGLSQYTANEMAKEGKTYQEILEYFYEGTEMVEVAEVLWNAE